MFRKMIVAGALFGALVLPSTASAKGFNAERYAEAYAYKYEDVRGFADCYKIARKTWRCTVEGETEAHTGIGYGEDVKLTVKIKHNYRGWYWYGWTLRFRYI